ncbi:hypothetical protein L1D55_19710 [Vibrio sp. Isolate22]|uniref:hypothetical protein n=1 Tax=Vibrio sp. Isolate22 TaxID=2908532 RepID=UPI001EFE2C05|nr:hypothetical protein [Vibrio sp. Isolate22]MCG9693944.1 hypothetical protein [Vibrio sp. Isolate22]
MLSKLIKHLDIDTIMVFFDKIIASIKGPLSVICVLFFLDPNQQGLWYTFISLSALVGLAEMGFTTVVSQYISHEYAKVRLRNGFVIFNRNNRELFAIISYALKLYFIIIPVAVIGLIIVGYNFFDNESSWIIFVWVAYSISSGINLLSVLLIYIYRGMDKVAIVHKIRAFSNILYITTLPIFLSLGFGLSSLPVIMILMVLLICVMLYYVDTKFWVQLYRDRNRPVKFNSQELKNLQIKYAVSFFSGYFMFNIFVPLVYKYQGSQLAGQLGLTLTVVRTISTFSYAWLESKLPYFNILISKGELIKFRDEFKKKFQLSGATFIFGMVAIALLYYASNYYSLYNDRVVSLEIFSSILGIEVGVYIMSCYAIYVRAHKVEPFHYISLISAIIIAAIAFSLIKSNNIEGAFYYIALVYWLFIVPFFYIVGKVKIRKRNHAVNCNYHKK